VPLPAQAELAAEARPLMPAPGEPLRPIHEGRIRSGPIDIRVPLPYRNTDLASPHRSSSTTTATPPPVHRRRLTMRNVHPAARRRESTGAGVLGPRRADQRVAAPSRPPERRAAGRLFVDESQKWSDALWETLTRDLTLSW